MIQLPNSDQYHHQPPHLSSSHYPKLNNQYPYSEVPFSSGDIKQEDSMPNLPSLPSIASMLDGNQRPQGQDQGQGQGQSQTQNQTQTQTQTQNQVPSAKHSPNQSQKPQPAQLSPAIAREQPQHQQAYHLGQQQGYPVHGQQSLAGQSHPQSPQQRSHVSSAPRESPKSTTSSPTPSVDYHNMQQPHPPHHHGYMAPPSGVSQVPQMTPLGVHQVPQVHQAHPQGAQVPQGVSQPHAHSQVQMQQVQVPSSSHHHQMPPYVIPPGMGHPGAPSTHGVPEIPGHPGQHGHASPAPQYMMDQQQQYWQKPQMYPMYPVMNGMQPMPPVMQYYPAASPYRQRGHSMGQEIKRRTKTGCLTCRRRRIKCDEQHPMCKNCSKSERICLGYDPILMSFSVDKNARLKQLQTKRRRFAQRQKYDKMRIISLVESTPVDAPHTWEQVVELFRSITPQLDELFETRQFSAIAQHVSQQLKHQGECKIVGELEVIRQLVAIIFSDRNFDALNVLDFPGANLEKLRTTNDYTLVRSLVEALTLADGTLHTAHVADERIHGKVMLMKQVIYAKEIRSPTPVSAGEILHSASNAVNNPQQAWITISDLLTRGGQDVQVTAPVGPLGTLVIMSAGKDAAQQLLLKDLDPFSRTLLELSLDPPQQA